jgi:hypothetical protein
MTKKPPQTQGFFGCHAVAAEIQATRRSRGVDGRRRAVEHAHRARPENRRSREPADVDLVPCVYDAFARGDVDAVFAAMTLEIEWDESEGMPYGGVYHVREAIVANVFGPILADAEGFTADPQEILALTMTE